MSPYNHSNNTESVQGTQAISITEVPPVLTLRASNTSTESKSKQKDGKQSQRSNVRWEQGTVDNEHMNKKKTKICCIFHPQDEDDEFAEPEVHFHDRPSDSDSDSDSSSSESEDDNRKGYNFEERRIRRIERRHKKLDENKPLEPNAYEFQPDYSHKKSNNNGLSA